MENSKSNSGVVWTVIIIIILVIVGIIIWHSHSSSNATSTTTGSTQSSGGVGAPMIPYYTLATSTSATSGTYLVAGNGMTLYTYSQDTPGSSTCSGNCAVTWPPYTVSSNITPTTSAGITGQVGFITRADGTTQVTYNNMPLYFYASDTSPGDVTGNNVGGFTIATP